MSSKIENIKFSVQLNSAIYLGVPAKETIEFIKFDPKQSQFKEKNRHVQQKLFPKMEQEPIHCIHTILEHYEQVNCYLNECWSSVLISKKSGEALLCGQLLEKIQKGNAKEYYQNNGCGITTLYLTYGYQYEMEGEIYQYQGYLNSYERDILCYQETGVMFGEEVHNITMKLEGIEKVLNHKECKGPLVKKMMTN